MSVSLARLAAPTEVAACALRLPAVPDDDDVLIASLRKQLLALNFFLAFSKNTNPTRAQSAIVCEQHQARMGASTSKEAKAAMAKFDAETVLEVKQVFHSLVRCAHARAPLDAVLMRLTRPAWGAVRLFV